MKLPAIRTVGSGLVITSSLIMFGGIANAQTIDTTGPDSTNIIRTDNTCRSSIDNTNIVDIINNNPQDASSGSVDADKNTTVGTVSSGEAVNTSTTNLGVEIINEGGNACAPATTQIPPSATPQAPVTPTVAPGGMGGGSETVEAQQVAMPVGAVGAGSGGPAYIQGLLAVTVASGVWAIARIRKLHNA